MKKAVLYARFSSENQDAFSIDAQIRHMTEFAEREGIEIVGTYTDEAQSAKDDNRTNFQVMMSDIKKGTFNIVLVHKFNRFARNRFDSAIYKKKLKEKNIRVIASAQPIDDTPEGQMLEGFLETIDEYYLGNLSLEVKKGFKEKALKAMHLGGKPPLGYSLNEDRKLVPNEKSIIVIKIFEMYCDGYGKSAIAKTLNALGYRSQTGNKLNKRTIFDILRNKKYLGYYVIKLDGEPLEIPNAHEPIISQALWDKAHEVNTKKLKPRMCKEDELYMLTGKLRCGVCGDVMTGNGYKTSVRGGVKKKYYYYVCVGKRNGNGCTNGALNKVVSEEKILKDIYTNILNNYEIDRIAKWGEKQALEEYQAPSISLDELQAERKELEAKRKRILRLYIDSKMPQEVLDEESEDINQQIIAIDKRIKSASVNNDTIISAEEIKEALHKIRNDFDFKDTFLCKAFIDTFVDTVTVDNKHLDVVYKLDFNNITSYGSVCDKVGLGRPYTTLSHNEPRHPIECMNFTHTLKK